MMRQRVKRAMTPEVRNALGLLWEAVTAVSLALLLWRLLHHTIFDHFIPVILMFYFYRWRSYTEKRSEKKREQKS